MNQSGLYTPVSIKALPPSQMNLFGPDPEPADSPSPLSERSPSPPPPPELTSSINDRVEAVLAKLVSHPTLLQEGEEEESSANPLDSHQRAVADEAEEQEWRTARQTG